MDVSLRDLVVMHLSDVLEDRGEQRTDSFVVDKVKRVSEILKGDPTLFEEPEVTKCLQRFRESNIDPRIKNLITDLMPSSRSKHSETSTSNILSLSEIDGRFDRETGILILSEKALDELNNDDAKTEEFWNLISSDTIKRLDIKGEKNNLISYGKTTLIRLVELRNRADLPERIPTIKDLTEKVTVTFEDGVNREVTKAKLKLFGEMIFIKVSSSIYPFEGTVVSPKVFDLILQEVETGEFDPSINLAEYEEAFDFLDFHPYGVLPESVIGQELLEKYLGDIGEVPRPSRELLEALEAPCPFSNDATIKTKDSHVVMWVPRRCDLGKLSSNRVEALINSEKSGANKIGFERNLCYFPEGVADEEVEGGYWLLMYKKPLEATRGMTYDDAEAHIHNNFENYDVPELIDATLGALLNYACSGEKKERILARENPLRYTWCKKSGRSQFGVWHMVVGALASSGLCVYRTMSLTAASASALCGSSFRSSAIGNIGHCIGNWILGFQGRRKSASFFIRDLADYKFNYKIKVDCLMYFYYNLFIFNNKRLG